MFASLKFLAKIQLQTSSAFAYHNIIIQLNIFSPNKHVLFFASSSNYACSCVAHTETMASLYSSHYFFLSQIEILIIRYTEAKPAALTRVLWSVLERKSCSTLSSAQRRLLFTETWGQRKKKKSPWVVTCRRPWEQVLFTVTSHNRESDLLVVKMQCKEGKK